MDRKEMLFNEDWRFYLINEDGKSAADEPVSVNLPHDWLIYNCSGLYESGTGVYTKRFSLKKTEGRKYLLNFDGIYMDSVIYVNGKEAGSNRYGYSSLEIDATGFLETGENEIMVKIRYKSPNSRWYSGAGIFRDVTFKEVNDLHIESDGVYVYAAPLKDKAKWMVTADIEIALGGKTNDENMSCESEYGDLSFDFDIEYIPESALNTECICRDICFSDIPSCLYAERGYEKAVYSVISEGFKDNRYKVSFILENARVWDITSPERYSLTVRLKKDGDEADLYTTCFGLRTIEFTTDKGFFLNGRKIKINGVCEHHDLGLLGAAFNKDAMRRKFTVLKEMGVNAVRTSHNMPAKKFMDLADEMGILVDSEGFDMWRRPKTEYDYARFFDENYKKDIRSWIRRDRNHPSVIMWSIGNEIYDCHADADAPELTRDMKETVESYDYAKNAVVTHGSNFMAWEGARKCADVLKLAGYNYGERLYEEQHREHPDWMIYGSETCSTVQSRGVYHFPLSVSLMADDDEQCSSLGNCTTSWGAPSTEYVITMDRDLSFSQGQFLWSGFDYIGEPTPYHTKNSYFGQIDTAGFPKDTYYIFKGSWTDPQKVPFVHIFPYWDFNPGQEIDVRVATNCDKVELYFKEYGDGIPACPKEETGIPSDTGYVLIGSAEIDHYHGKVLAPAWKLPYKDGRLLAVGYIRGKEAARECKGSFGDAKSLNVKEIFTGEDTVFFEINALDEKGNLVENAGSRVKVEIEGNGELLGLDNGDSTDNEDYKTDTRRLFSGKLLACVRTGCGENSIKITSEGLVPAELCFSSGQKITSRIPSADFMMRRNILALREKKGTFNDIPVRNIKLRVCGLKEGEAVRLDKDHRVLTVKAEIMPLNATYSDIRWAAVNDRSVPANNVKIEPFENEDGHFIRLTALGDGKFRLRAMAYNGERVAKVISVLEFDIKDIGKAFINPYEFVYGSLYSASKGDIGNGNEKGIATPREPGTYFGFENVDFGDNGSDEITIPIFTLNDDKYKIGIWEGKPYEEGSVLLCDGTYSKKSIWNVYQPETFHLSKKLKGITSIYFTADDKYHFKGFVFRKPDKAYEKHFLSERSRIYGDTFIIEGEGVTGIGNNVTIEFDCMDFGDEPAGRIVICGRSCLKNNSIHLKFDGAEGTRTELLEFEGAGEYTERSFQIQGARGMNTVGFVFLPGCNFDFKYFRFYDK